MKTMLAAITLAVLSSYASGYDRNQSIGEEWQQRGQTEESQKIEQGARQREIENSNRMQQLSTSRDYNNRRTNGGKDSSRRSNSACGFGRVEWRPSYMATMGNPGLPRDFAFCMIGGPNPAGSGDLLRWLRKKLFGALAIKRFDARMINPNGRILVTVGIKPFY